MQEVPYELACKLYEYLIQTTLARSGYHAKDLVVCCKDEVKKGGMTA